MFLKLRAGLFTSILFLVAACGGGGGGGGGSSTPPPSGNNPPPAPTAEDTANASASQLKMELRADTRELTITWTDTFSAETTYLIEARASGGAWQTVDTLAPSAGTGNSYQWKRIIDASRTYRVSATKTGYAVPLANSQGQTEIAVNLPPAPMTLQFNQTSPATGTVELSIANAVDVQSVTYYIDLKYLDNNQAGPDFRSTWNSLDVGDGEHLVTATVHQTSGATVELRGTIVIDNPGLRISLSVSKGTPMWMFGRVLMNATITSELPVQQVEFFDNDGSLHIATAPTFSNVWEYEELRVADLPGGINVFRAVVTNVNGETAEATAELLIDNYPRLTVTSPADGAIVRGTLHVEGTYSEDYSTATLGASLGSVQILSRSTPGAFSLDYSLAGLPPGQYQFTAAARDEAGQTSTITRRIIIPEGNATYEPVDTEVAELLATSQGAVVYRKVNGTMIARNAAGVATTLQVPAGLTQFSKAQLSNGYVVLEAMSAATFVYHVYVFAPNGEATNLSASNGANAGYSPVLKGSWVAWRDTTRYQIYNLDTHAVVNVLPPPGVTFPQSGFYLVSTPGNEQLFFWGQTGGTPTNPISDVFRYNVQTQTTDLITGGDSHNHNIQTDNARVAWLKGANSNQYELLIAPANNLSATTVVGVTNTLQFKLRDGMLAWYSNGLRANDGTTTRDVSTGGTLYSVGDGRVLYSQNGRLMLSPSTGGASQTLLNVLPVKALHDDDSAFIATGSSDSMSLYRMQLP